MNIKKLLTSWHLWIVFLAMGAFLIFQRSTDVSVLLPVIIILLCPIMMMFMMDEKGHKH